MTGIVDWAAGRARMVFAFILLSIAAGYLAYTNLPKEGEPDIDIPMIFVSVNFPGISASDSERLLIKPLEQQLRDIDGLDDMTAFASDGYGGMLLKFEFGWNKPATIAEVRDRVDRAKTDFPEGYDEPSVDEFNFSEFPILILSLSGDLPERTLMRLAKDLQNDIESLTPVLEAALTGYRDELVEVLIDPLKLEAYNVTAEELIQTVSNNNRLVAAGSVETGSGQFAVKLPGSFETVQDIYALPVKVNGDSVVTIGDLATIHLTYEDAEGTARYNGTNTVALQVIKRKGFPVIDTVDTVKAEMERIAADWPEPLKQAVTITYAMDESQQVAGMVSQLESSVLTAIALVMIVVLGALGIRSALLVGFAIPTSFLLCFALLSVFGMSITNIVMFGLILAVGMLVDGAIVVVEYADQKIQQGVGPMRAYVAAAKRMFWPVISSTATTLCAFLPMLFWPGVPGQFMGNLPVTLIFVLSASLVVALVYLPVVGGVAGRISTIFSRAKTIDIDAIERKHKRTGFGYVIKGLTGNAVMPFVAIGLTFYAITSIFSYYGAHNNGVEFFVDTEPERGSVYVRARGNLSLHERDRILQVVEQKLFEVPGISSAFSFAGSAGFKNRGGEAPNDVVGTIQFELAKWDERGSGKAIIDHLREHISTIPGVITEVALQADGPQQGKPIQLRVEGDNWQDLLKAAQIARQKLENIDGLVDLEDTRPLPGIDWNIDVDVAQAGKFGADTSAIGIMVTLVTRGLTLDTMRPDGSDEEVDIRVRYPEEYRVISTLDSMRVRTAQGLIPLSNFITREPVPKLGEINRYDGVRFFDIKADVADGVNVNEKIAEISAWLNQDKPLPLGIDWSFTGDQEEQEESQAFLGQAFIGALGLMFVILLAQFNSIYNSLLVLSAVVMSVAGVLVGMLVMGQPFSIIMTGTGVVALAGIVVNNNIVLIDTYQEYARRMPRLEAIVRTAEQRIRPVLLTTITTMAGLTPMMFGISVDFFNGGYTIDSPTALWWKQLATAVVFGLGMATVLTLVVTPTMLAIRVWVGLGTNWVWTRVRLAFTRKPKKPAYREYAANRALRIRGSWQDPSGLKAAE